MMWMMDDRLAFLREAKEQGVQPLIVVRKIKQDGLFEKGKEFNVAVDLKAIFGLTAHQLHDVVGWLRGVIADEVLENSLVSRE
jgi:hypothetical protein